GRVRVGRGSGDDDLLRAGAQVLLRVEALAELAGRLDHHVDAELAPGEPGGVARGGRRDLDAVDDDRVLARLDDARERAVDAVVAQQLGEQLGRGDVVDRHELELGARLVCGAEGGTAGAAEPVDGHAWWHESSSFGLGVAPSVYRSGPGRIGGTPYRPMPKSRNASFSDVFRSVDSLRRPTISAQARW